MNKASTGSGKGWWRRPCSTTREEQNLRDKYASGGMTFTEFERKYKKLIKQGLIKRNGRTIKDVKSKSTDN